MIVDYSTARPTMAALKSAGVTAVGRYIGWDSVPGYKSIGKNITTAEAAELRGVGISIFLAFEYAANAAVNGATQGTSDGGLAIAQLIALSAPMGMAVYFAVDFDIPDYAPGLPDIPANARAKLGPVADYFAAIVNLKPPYEVGVYGGYYAVNRLLNAGLVTKAWQATAWSGGNLDPRAVLYQTTSAAPVSGGDTDIRGHATTVEDYGQWPRPSITPPKPGPVPQGSGMAYVLDLPDKLARVLPVPTGCAKMVVYADSAASTVSPIIRVGFGPAWSEVEVKPTWSSPSVITVPPGESRVTISRQDVGSVPVTIDFP